MIPETRSACRAADRGDVVERHDPKSQRGFHMRDAMLGQKGLGPNSPVFSLPSSGVVSPKARYKNDTNGMDTC